MITRTNNPVLFIDKSPVLTVPVEKNELRKELHDDVERFLKSGGMVKELEGFKEVKAKF